MELYTALTKHDAQSGTTRKAPLSMERERVLFDRLHGEDAVKSALDAMVRQLRSTHASSTSDAVRQLLDRLDRNHDGRLQQSELHSGLLELGLHPVSSDVDAVMRYECANVGVFWGSGFDERRLSNGWWDKRER